MPPAGAKCSAMTRIRSNERVSTLPTVSSHARSPTASARPPSGRRVTLPAVPLQSSSFNLSTLPASASPARQHKRSSSSELRLCAAAAGGHHQQVLVSSVVPEPLPEPVAPAAAAAVVAVPEPEPAPLVRPPTLARPHLPPCYRA